MVVLGLKQSIGSPGELLVADVQIGVGRRLVEVGVALGEVPRRQKGAGDGPHDGDLLPLGRLIGVVVGGGGHAASSRGLGGGPGARRQGAEAGSRRQGSHGWWCRWFRGMGVDWLPAAPAPPHPSAPIPAAL